MKEDFILESCIDDLALCDDIIAYFNTNPRKTESTIVGKQATDLALNFDMVLMTRYLQQLSKVTAEYIAKYPWCSEYGRWGVEGYVNVQHYKPDQSYYGWHSERTTADPRYNNRHLVFMTYLNDVTDKGETEWLHQEKKVQPRKGHTLIWPTDWTYTHRGIASPTQDKYIVTGWFSYLE